MLPSWFTRLRDVKGGSKHKQHNKLRAPSPLAKRHDEDSASFAKSWSLQRANSKAKGVCTEADITSTCNYSCLSISHEATSLRVTENECNLQDADQPSKDATALLLHSCANLDPWDHDFISMSSCKRASKSPSSKETKALVQKTGHGVSDNDTEDFTLTSETRSSFCSETSTADSSVSCKSGCDEKGNQDERDWRGGDVCIRSLGLMAKDLQENCNPHTAELMSIYSQNSHTAELMSTYCQRSAQMQQDIWRGRGSFLFSFLTAGRCRSVGSNAESRSTLYESSAGREHSLKTNEASSLVENQANLVQKNVGDTSSKSSEWGKENFASTKNIPSLKLHNRSNAETCDKSFEKSDAVAEANLNLVFDHGDMYGCTSDSSEKSNVDSLSQSFWLEKRNELFSTSETPSATASSIGCAPPESAEESKGRVSSTRRRRQRGASISAVLPPDLQGVVGDSLALVKMSDDPYEDFRQSIYEMIMEKDLEGSMDVEELLYCYLSLNAPEHHRLIEEVFSDVWSAILMTFR